MNVDDALLIDFLLDAVSAEVRVQLQHELDIDAELRARLAELSDDFAILAMTTTPVSPSPALRDRVMAFEDAGLQPGLYDRLAALFDLPAKAIHALAADISCAPGSPWQPGPRAGLSILPVAPGPGVTPAAAHLVHIAPGANLPAHEHLGHETMLILDGYARESSGRTVAPGDLIKSAPKSRHHFEILVDTPCLFAVVVDGSVRFEGEDPR